MKVSQQTAEEPRLPLMADTDLSWWLDPKLPWNVPVCDINHSLPTSYDHAFYHKSYSSGYIVSMHEMLAAIILSSWSCNSIVTQYTANTERGVKKLYSKESIGCEKNTVHSVQEHLCGTETMGGKRLTHRVKNMITGPHLR